MTSGIGSCLLPSAFCLVPTAFPLPNPVKEVPRPHTHVVNQRIRGDGGKQEPADRLRQGQWPDVAMACKHFREENSRYKSSNHKNRIRNVGGTEHNPDEGRTHVAIADDQHQSIMEVGLGQILLKCTPAPIAEQRNQGLPGRMKKQKTLALKSVVEQGQA